MAQVAQSYSIQNPGFFGLNKQDSPVDMPSGFALLANNCVIDSSGRIAARKGWSKVNTANTDLSTSNITCMGELVETSGATTVLAAGGAFLFKLVGATLTTLTYGGGGVAPTISASNWQFCQLNGVGIFFQRGFDPLIYEPAVSTTTFRRLSERAGYVATVTQCDTAISAYGRIWAANTTADKRSLIWSDLLSPHVWTTGTSGSLNLNQVWPNGSDEIVSLAAHNNFLIIFGKRQTLVYSGANSPSTMVLSDAIGTVGCIARDSVQNIGSDVIFLSSVGVQSLGRTIQEKSAPMADISKNVRDELMATISAETAANIKSVYHAPEAFYLLTFPATSSIYCFDFRSKLETGAARVTSWDSNVPKAFLSTVDRKLYMGKPGYVGMYGTYLDDTLTYRMTYLSPNIDFGEPVITTILKKILITTVSLQQTAVVKWAFDFLQRFYSQSVVINAGSTNTGLYNISEYNTVAEYTTPIAANIVGVNASGTGKTVQIGMDVQINGYALSLQKIDVFTKRGKLR